MDAYIDSTGAYYSRNTICILGNGSWYFFHYTAPAPGHWAVNGNDIHLNGTVNSPTNIPMNESLELTRIYSNLLTGYLSEWTSDGTFSRFYTVKLVRISSTCS